MARLRPADAAGVVLAVVALAAGPAAASEQAIWLTAIQPFTGGAWDAGVSMRIGCQIMLEEINRNPNLLPGYELKVAWQDGRCAEPVGAEIFLANLFDQKYKVFAPGKTLTELDADRDGTVTTADTEPMGETWNSTRVIPGPVGLIGPGCSVTSLRIAKVAYMARLPVVSNSATSPDLSDRGIYPNFFRTIMPDTTFNSAWVAIARQLGHSSVSVVIGETARWGVMGKMLAEAALSQGVQLVGNDLTADMPNFNGTRVALESQAMVAAAAADVARFRQRIIILLMFQRRNRLLLCELFKLHFRNAVYMPVGWLPFGWWSVPDTQCTPGQLTDMAVGFISANMMFWRGDMDTRLSCSFNMTAQHFQDEWFRRQGGTHGDLSMRPEGFAPATEAATTADAACMYATMLHEVLIGRGVPLSELTGRTRWGYDNAFDALSNIDFEGVQGRVRFAPSSADPAGSVILQQLQLAGGSLELLDVASYSNATFRYLGRGDLVFQFPGERFPAGPAGAASISGDLAQFKVCTGSRVLDTLSNECVDCPANKQLVQRAAACLCVAGFFEAAGDCEPCPGGTISTSPGALQCTSCGPGKFAPPGSTSCSFCPRGKFSNSSGLEACHDCQRLQTTVEIASESAASCVCEAGSYRGNRSGGDDACVQCPPNSHTHGLDSPNVSSCLCAEDTYMDLASEAACRPCPTGSTTTGAGKTSVQSCLCARGTYMRADATKCLPCPDGMLCPRGSNEANKAYLSTPSKSEEQEFPRLRAGFWSSASEPMSVFACRSAQKCPGDRYPGNACASNLIERACDHCDAGFHWAGTHCSRCADLETTYLLFPTVPLILVPLLILAMYKFCGDQYARWGSRRNGVVALLCITLNHFQTVDVMAGANIRSLDLSGGLLGAAEPTNNYASVFNLDCVGLAGFRDEIIVRGLAPPILLGCCLAAFACSGLAARITRRAQAALDWDRLCNVLGSLLFTFSSALAALSLLLFKCARNPNGTQSLAADMSVICFDSPAWNSTLGVGIALVLVYIVGLGGACIRAVRVAPRFFASRGFQMRWKFLFMRYRVDVHWWSIAFLAKNVFVNLALVVTIEGVAQLHTSMAVVAAYMTLMLATSPYRHRIANALEYVVSVSAIYIGALLTRHADRLHGSMDAAIDLSIGLVCLLPPIVAIGCIVSLGLFGNRFPAPTWQQQEAQKDFEDLIEVFAELSVLPVEEGFEVLLHVTEWDRWYMKQVIRAMKADVIGSQSPNHQCSSLRIRRLVDTSLRHAVSQNLDESRKLRAAPSMALDAKRPEQGDGECACGAGDAESDSQLKPPEQGDGECACGAGDAESDSLFSF